MPAPQAVRRSLKCASSSIIFNSSRVRSSLWVGYGRRCPTALELSRLELVERLVSLVPPPRANQVHYHGVLASRSRLRGRVRPKVPKAKKRPASVGKRLSKR
ncbi:MAG TPA: hypothetical protein DFR83_20315, partial [Deltaproteobacteria bacterium]|nr:hypothetical protein [Deltaproteobacteria bacterium]